MACPFFFPTERLASPVWPHPSRLPLGAAWNGRCTCSQGALTEAELKDGCNLGYARECSRLPRQRPADAVRMGIARDRDGRITLRFVLELEYLPAGGGLLEYDSRAGAWFAPHPDSRIQRMAECYLESYLLRRQS